MPEVITSPSNPKVKQLLALQQKSSARRERGLFVVEGRRELQHCIDAGFIIDTIFVCPTLSETAPLHGGSPLPDFASLIPPRRFAGGPPVHEATGGHGPAGESPRSAAPAADKSASADRPGPETLHFAKSERDLRAAGGSGDMPPYSIGRGPAQPDVSGGWLPRNEVALPSVVFWSQNWRKGGLQPRRNEIVREQCFYNQNWCGCEFSKRQTL